jgi:hypothetical protein
MWSLYQNRFVGKPLLESCNDSSAGNSSDKWTVTQVLSECRVRGSDETSLATIILLQVSCFAAYKRLLIHRHNTWIGEPLLLYQHEY